MGASWAVLACLGGLLGGLGGILDPLWTSSRLSWTLLGELGSHLALLEAILSRHRGFVADVEVVCAAFRVAGALGRSPMGSFFGKEPKPNRKKFSTPGTPVINQQGAADRRRLRRITAAPCLFGKRLCGQTVGPRTAQAIRLCLLPAALEALRGTLGGGRQGRSGGGGGGGGLGVSLAVLRCSWPV